MLRADMENASDPVALEPPISLARLVGVLRLYRRAILVMVLSVMALYSAMALGLFALAPANRVTGLRFRVDFEGAQRGEYPNGLRFSPTEIIASPILLRVYEDNELSRYVRFADFSRGLTVQEHDPTYESMATDYEGRLADPRLGPVDRERLLADYDARRAGRTRNLLVIQWSRSERLSTVPEEVVRKVLSDVLAEWARKATEEQQVFAHRLALLTPDAAGANRFGGGDPVVGLQVLRTNVARLIDHVDRISLLPGAELARVQPGNLSIADLRMRLEDILRFRLEPLVPLLGAAERPRARAFAQAQLAYDHRLLTVQQGRATAIREALALYVMDRSGTEPSGASHSTPGGAPSATVMPQLNDAFLDRLVALTTNAADATYRQKLVDRYQRALEEATGLQGFVSYDEQVLSELDAPPVGAAAGRGFATELAAGQRELNEVTASLHDLYLVASRNLHPATHLYGGMAPALTHTSRGRSATQLVLYGLLLLAMALPAAAALALLHHRWVVERREIAIASVSPVA